MNIQEMHRIVDLLMDRSNSPRFKPTAKDDAINIAINRVIKDRYDNIKNQKRYSFQSAQRVRDELRTLVKQAVFTNITNNTITVPADYRHEVSMFALIDGKSIPSRPTNYDELGPLLNNSFERPTFFSPVHLEVGSEVNFYFGDKGVLTEAKMNYIKDPVKVNLANSIDSDMPEELHDEICQLAASILSGTVQDANRRAFLEQENGMS